jgi:REP element-mobilizing transposase RayT
MKQPPHQSALRSKRWSWPDYCYFVTTNSAGKRPVFSSEISAEIIVNSLVWLQDNGRVRLMGFVVMPDHVHVAFVLSPEQQKPVVGAPFRARSGLSQVMNSFKGYTGKKINELLQRRGDVWQSAYHDHLVRDEKDFRTRLEYMHANPVRRGLVRLVTEYRFSSANPKYQDFVDWDWLLGVEQVAPGRALLQSGPEAATGATQLQEK